MNKEWPAKEVQSLIELIDDPRHGISKEGFCSFSEEQTKAILELRLQRLTAIGKEDIEAELDGLKKDIEDYLLTLKSKDRVIDIIKKELIDIKNNFSIPRRTEIIEYVDDVQDEDLIKKEEMAVTVSHTGYIKRVPLSTYRSQNRGGKGRSGMQTKDEDFVTNIFVANTHQPILFFSSTGMVYRLKTYLLPVSSPQAKGKALINLLPLEKDEVITTIMPLPADESEWENLFVMFVTSSGGIRRNNLSDFSRINKNGKIAMKPAKDETIISVQTCTNDNDILLATKKGQCIRFSVDKVRVFASRSSTGVRGIKLDKGDSVIGMTILNHVKGSNEEFRSYLKAASIMRRAKDDEEDITTDDEGNDSDTSVELSTERYAELAAKEEVILTVASNGQGKRTSSYEYRLTNRGGKGVISITLAKSNADVVSSFPVEDTDQIMLIDDNGQLIRCPVSGIRIMGRNTQGVKIFNIDEKYSVVSVERVVEQDEDENEGEEI